MMRHPKPHVAVCVSTYAAYGQALMRGVIEAAERRSGWRFEVVDRRDPEAVDWAGLRGFDGVVAEVRSEASQAAAVALGRPVVAVTGDVGGGRGQGGGLPRVTMDQRAIGRMAAEHLLDLGLRRLAAWTIPEKFYARQRVASFVDAARERAVEPDLREEGEPLHGWLRGLPKPVGVFAVNDEAGVAIIRACGELGLDVPHDVAVLGVDNDEVLCRLVRPGLSSIDTGNERVGRLAVELLERLLAGEEPPASTLTVPPLEVIERPSTDTLAVEHGETAAAIRFIREHACEGIAVANVLRAVPAARRTLEGHFQRLLGRTVHAEIRRVQLDRVKHLLAVTDWDMPEIAAATGFSYASRLSTVFRRDMGVTPTEYRRAARSG